MMICVQPFYFYKIDPRTDENDDSVDDGDTGAPTPLMVQPKEARRVSVTTRLALPSTVAPPPLSPLEHDAASYVA